MDFILQLVLDLLASWGRMFAALLLSIVFSVAVGVAAATNRRAENILIPVLDVLQTLPILAFFPVVISVFVLFLPGYIGINAAIVALIFTSMAWNISFGVYEAVKSIPDELLEVARINHLSGFQMLKSIYVPASMPRIAYQSALSWSVGLFYLVTSEIFSTGGQGTYAAAYGIGVEIAHLVSTSNTLAYATALAFFVVAVLLTRWLFLQPLSIYSEKFSFKEEQRASRRSRVLALYSGIGRFIEARLPEITVEFRRRRAPVRAKPQAGEQAVEGSGSDRKISSASAVSAVIVSAFLVSAVAAIALANYYSFVPTLLTSLALSFLRVWGMYLLCAAIAIPLGILIVKSTRAYETIFAVLQVAASIPATILLPVIVLMFMALPFGNELTALAIIFLAMIWYLLFSVIAGMRTIPEQFDELLGIYKAGWAQAWRDVYIPALLPSFVTGSITAIGGAWNALIVAEYFGTGTSCGGPVVTQVGSGIGKLLSQATYCGNYLQMFLAIAAMVIMVMVINRLVWQRIYRHVTLKYRIE